MFELLKLTNFQTHRSLEINLDRRITTIIGPSDAGKSAIIRALRWVCLNEASGGFRKHGTNHSSVKLTADGQSIRRKKTGQRNSYTLDGKKFYALRRDVPGGVRRLLNVSEINFQSQHDPPYWLSNSAGEVSRQLNAIVDLGIIDSTLSNVAGQLRQAQATYNVTEQRLEAAKEEATSLAWLEECEAEYKEVERLEAAYTAAQQSRSNLADLVKQLQAYQLRRRQAAKRLLLGHKALALGRVAKAARGKAARLRELVMELDQATRLATVEVPDISEWEDVRNERMQLEDLIGQIQQGEDQLCQVQKRLARSSERLEKNLRGRCPTCGQLIKM